jgi:hypothetical protein
VLVGRGGGRQRLPEVRDHIGDADPAGDGHAVPAALAVVASV